MTPKAIWLSGMLTVPVTYKHLGPKIEKIKMKGELEKLHEKDICYSV